MLWKINVPPHQFEPESGGAWPVHAHPSLSLAPFLSLCPPVRDLFFFWPWADSQQTRLIISPIHPRGSIFFSPPLQPNQHCCHHPFRLGRGSTRSLVAETVTVARSILSKLQRRRQLDSRNPLVINSPFHFPCFIFFSAVQFIILCFFPLSRATVRICSSFFAFYATIVFFFVLFFWLCPLFTLPTSDKSSQAADWPQSRPAIDLVPPDENANGYLIVSADGQGGNELPAAEIEIPSRNPPELAPAQAKLDLQITASPRASSPLHPLSTLSHRHPVPRLRCWPRIFFYLGSNLCVSTVRDWCWAAATHHNPLSGACHRPRHSAPPPRPRKLRLEETLVQLGSTGEKQKERRD